jgi:predicted TIM-barrel fold metal-dependent hydrolase
MPQCQPADPNPRPPRFKAPPGATDTHFHIFGPEEKYPLVANRRFTPPDASVESYLHLHHTLGLSRAVLVQPSSYGTDNRRQLDAAREMDIPTRVIVVAPPAGARAVRFIPTQPGSLPLAQLEHYAERLAALGWHIQLMLAPAFARTRVAPAKAALLFCHRPHGRYPGCTGDRATDL